MASALTVYWPSIGGVGKLIVRSVGACCLSFWLSGCGDGESVVQQSLSLPEREESAFITDQVYVAGNSLSLWDKDGGCQLKVSGNNRNTGLKPQWLKPMAPCYFIKSPGTEKVQVFRQDKARRVVAVLGTAIAASQAASAKRCGREVQGLLISGSGKVRLSSRVLSGSVYCAESGLDNFQYSLFHGS